MKKIWLIVSAISVLILSGCATEFNPNKIDDWQPKIVTPKAPKVINFGMPLSTYTTEIRFADFDPIIPSYNKQGNLLASWNPGPGDINSHPTFVYVHGGHGLTAADFGEARWAQSIMGANVLILDSFWSRGELDNFKTFTKYGANMRVLDALAAGKWLRDVKGVDPKKLFIMGDSQGGWTVLRLFTKDPFYMEENKNLYRAGFALYPNCVTGHNSYAPDLGPYYAPVLIFTGELDTATPWRRCDSDVFTQAYQWTNYLDAGHGFDTMNRGFGQPAADKECHDSLNNFKVCRNDAAVFDMHSKVFKFVKEQTGMTFEAELAALKTKPYWYSIKNRYPEPIKPYQAKDK